MEVKDLEKMFDLKLENVHFKLDSIKEQTTKTNGNVIENQNRIGALENWRWYIIGGGTVLLLIIKFL